MLRTRVYNSRAAADCRSSSHRRCGSRNCRSGFALMRFGVSGSACFLGGRSTFFCGAGGAPQGHEGTTSEALVGWPDPAAGLCAAGSAWRSAYGCGRARAVAQTPFQLASGRGEISIGILGLKCAVSRDKILEITAIFHATIR
jgi:hypothetical protein